MPAPPALRMNCDSVSLLTTMLSVSLGVYVRCYPNTTATACHKLHVPSIACVFLGYPSDHCGYRCFDPLSRQVLTSRHVLFGEATFHFARSIATNPVLPLQLPAAPVLQVPVLRRPTTRNQPRPQAIQACLSDLHQAGLLLCRSARVLAFQMVALGQRSTARMSL